MVKHLKFFWLYLGLSSAGKKLFRQLRDMLSQGGSPAHSRQLLASVKEIINTDSSRWFYCLRASDAGFKEFIPDWYIRSAKIKPEQLYYRFFKMAAILLYEHTALFSAYNIKVGREAGKRCVLISFLKRVYDDLLDSGGLDKEVLFALTPDKGLIANPDYRLFLELRGKIRQLAKPAEFANYYSLLKQVSDAQDNRTAGGGGNIPFKIKNGFLLDMYIMMNDLPQAVNRALDVTAEFFACLDDFYDYDEDLAKGKVTVINQSLDPRRELEDKYAQAQDYLRANSPNPQGYLTGALSLMKNVLFLRENKLNKLSLFI